MSKNMEIAVRCTAHAEGIETLTTRNRDSLDFHDLSVTQIKRMLEAAYKAGAADAHKREIKVTISDTGSVTVTDKA